MASTSIAQPARTVPATEGTKLLEPVPGYVLRGLGLFELHAEEILAGYQGGGKWLIPSGTVADRHYEVRVGVRRPSTCECIGHRHHSHCSHVEVARLAAKKSAVCDCCGHRRWDWELVEVTEDDELLSWFPGDSLCLTCVPRYWA